MADVEYDKLKARYKRKKAGVIDKTAPLESAKLIVQQNYMFGNYRTLHHYQGTFLKWNGACYVEFPNDSLRSAVYLFLDRSLVRTKTGLTAFKPNKYSVGMICDALAAYCHLDKDLSPPCWLTDDRAPPAREIVACRNGLVHLPSSKLLSPSPRFFCVNALPYAFNKGAPKPKHWLDFLHSIWADDVEVVATLQEVFGYFLSGTTAFQKLFLLAGPKRSGKGTIGRVLTAMLGKESVVSPTLTALATNFGRAPLVGKTASIIADARLGGKTDQQALAELLLSISGEDLQTIDRKFLPAWTGQITTRFLIMTNELPQIADASGALPSRFVVLTLTKSFYEQEDKSLTGRLLMELPGIMNWALEGWLRLSQRGHFNQPRSSADAVRDLEDLSSPIGAFVRDCCIVGADHNVNIDILFKSWCAWSSEEGNNGAGVKQMFARNLRALVPSIKVTQPRRIVGTRPRMYVGIGLRSLLARDGTQ